MNIKIYHLNKTIYLSNDFEISGSNITFLRLNNITEVDFIKAIETQEDEIIVFLYKDLEALKNTFFSQFTLIIAGGGVVENSNKKVLMIYRRNHWDLPKGKWDSGETIEECALREIEEETGVNKLQIQKHLLNTYHTYFLNDEWILKETFWYYMTTETQKKLKPQAEEDIEEVKWVAPTDLKKLYKLSFPSVVDVLKEYLGGKSAR
jgi:8-oxo-dGTP pyrophosphatase MutT (NUDIX family)